MTPRPDHERILIKNGRLIDPATGVDETTDLLIEGDRIAALGAGRGGAATVIDAGGLIVAPGLIDIHVHFREPGQEEKECIATGARAAAAGGFTAVAPMANTKPPTEGRAGVAFVNARAKGAAVRIYPVATVTKGMAGEHLAEMAEAADEGAVAFSDDGKPLMHAGLMRRAISYAGMLGKPLLLHEEDLGLTDGGVMNEGETATRLGLPGMPREAEAAMIARDCLLANPKINGVRGRIHVQHVSVREALPILKAAKADGVPVTCEVAPHHFTLTDAAVGAYDTNAKMSPPLRTAADVDALIAALIDGTIDCIATDHAPHTLEEKERTFSEAPFGIVGLETALGLSWSALVASGRMTPMRLIALLSANPARVLGLPGGRIAPGEPADLTLIDPKAEWVVDPDRFYSRGRNTPYAGAQLLARAAMTIVGGRIVMRDGEVLA